MGDIFNIPFKIKLTDEVALEYMDVINWNKVSEEALESLSPEIRKQIDLLLGYSINNERYTTSNGLTMIRSKPLNWKVESKYFDGSGPERFYISVGGLSKMIVCSFDPETYEFSIDGNEFSVDSLESAGEIVSSFAEKQKLRIGSIYTE